MAFQPVVDVAEVVFEHRYTGATEPYDIVWHFDLAGGWDGTTIQNLAEAARDAWVANLASLAPDTAVLHEVRTRDLTTEDGARYVLTDDNPGTGASLTWLPPNCATGVILRCAGAGFPRHGFSFWPFVLEADCDRIGTLSGAALTVPGAMEDAAGDIVSTVWADNHVVVSRFETIDNPTPPPARISVERDPAVYNVVTSYAIGRGGFVAAQRDRRPGA